MNIPFMLNIINADVLIATGDSRKTFTRWCCLSVLFVLSVCLSVAKVHIQLKARFKKKQSNLELWFLLTTNRMSYMGFSKNSFLDPNNQDGGHLKNRQVAISRRKIIRF